MDKDIPIPVDKNETKTKNEVAESVTDKSSVKKRVRPTILNRPPIRPIPLALSIPSPSFISSRASGQTQGPHFALKNHRIKLEQFALNMDKFTKSHDVSDFTRKSFKNNSTIGTTTPGNKGTGTKKKFQNPSIKFTNTKTLVVNKKVGNLANPISTSKKLPINLKSALKQPTYQIEGWPKMREPSDHDGFDTKNANYKNRRVHYSESISGGVGSGFKEQFNEQFKNLGEFKKKNLPQKNLLLTNGITYFGFGSNGENLLPTFDNFTNSGSSCVEGNWRSNENTFRTTVNMAGFEDEEISFGYETGRLFITGMKMKQDKVHASRWTEIVQLPNDYGPDRLQVLKDSEGILYIEEKYTKSK